MGLDVCAFAAGSEVVKLWAWVAEVEDQRSANRRLIAGAWAGDVIF
jgi:hypothetical protein